MSLSEVGFWVCVALVAYPYLVYPLLLAMLARVRGRPVRRAGGVNPPRESLSLAASPLGGLTPPARQEGLSVSFLVCAHNEQAGIERRLVEFVSLLERTGIAGEIVVVSDGSTDDTASVVAQHSSNYVRLVELPQRVGKAAALSLAVEHARNDVLVFADVRQTWADDALELLLENFADPQVGAVSGDLVVSARPGAMSGVGLYWRYEKWLRRNESLVWSQVGVTGAISACRRDLFEAIPEGMLLDDVYWPLRVAMKGYRVVHDSQAVAHDRLPDRARDEFRRKVRTLAGNFQLVARLPQAMLPWRNPVWVQLVSHKLARLVVPWALLGLAVFSACAEGWFFKAALAAQAVGYLLGVIGLRTKRGGRLISAAGSFLVLNAAAWVAFWVWITGRAGRSWSKVAYDGFKKPLQSLAR